MDPGMPMSLEIHFRRTSQPTTRCLSSTPEQGGSSDDTALGIAVDSSGNAYVTGETTDTNKTVATGDFPVTTGAFQTSYGKGSAAAGSNGFVTKLNAAGSGLVYSTYLGGST